MRQVFAVILIAVAIGGSGRCAWAESEDVAARMTRLAERAAQQPGGVDQDTLPTPESLNREPIGASQPPQTVASEDNPYIGGSNWILSTLTSLGLVIGLILALRWGWSKMGGKVASQVSPVVEVLSRTSVAPKNQVMLLRVGGRILVVSDSSAGMSTLCEVSDPEEVADLLASVTATRPDSITRGFGQMLGRFGNEYEPELGRDTQEAQIDRTRDSVSGALARIRALKGEEDMA